MHSALVNSVMIRPQPPKPRIMRRKTVSVTPAIGASTVVGEMCLSRIEKDGGNICFRVIARRDSELAILQQAQQMRQWGPGVLESGRMEPSHAPLHWPPWLD